METDVLSKLSKEQLEELVRTYARNMLALDGVWFQSVERELGMDRAMRHDERVWQAFTQTEARRIKGLAAFVAILLNVILNRGEDAQA